MLTGALPLFGSAHIVRPQRRRLALAVPASVGLVTRDVPQQSFHVLSSFNLDDNGQRASNSPFETF